MTDSTTSEVQLLAQADLLLLVADLLRAPAESGATIDDKNRDGRCAFPSCDDLTELLAAARLPCSEPLSTALRAALSLAHNLSPDRWSDEYHRLFEGPLVCSPNETTYIRRDKGALIADINGFYLAFGFACRQSTGEKPDHLLCQLEFIALLLVMIAAAVRHDAPEKEEVARRALFSFADSHLGDWLASFCHRLLATTTVDLYSAAAAALLQLWQSLVQAHHLPEPAAMRLSPEEEPPSPCECAMVPPATAAEEHP